MSKTFVAIQSVPGVTLVAIDGTPYRTDSVGVAYVSPAHASEFQASKGTTVLTNTAGVKNPKLANGAPLTLHVENTP